MYARTFDSETQQSSISKVKPKLSFYIKDDKSSEYKSALTKEPLKEITFNSEKEYRDAIKMYKDMDVTIYGNKSLEQCYIRENFINPLESNHDFHTWFIDIETMVDIKDPNHDKKLDWKAMGSNRSAKAIITSIQIYDTKSRQFYIFGLNKEWKNETNFTSEFGEIKYFSPKSESNMLKGFLKLLQKRNPTLIVGFNSFGYDFPYITNRIIRVLDERDDLYVKDKYGTWLFNKETLNGAYVKQLSPVGIITHRTKEGKYGGYDDYFEYLGIFLEDYADLILKYANTPLPDNSLNTIAEHWLGEGKVNHDVFDDFGAWYRGDYEHYIYDKNFEDTELDKLYIKLIDKNTYTIEDENRFRELSYDLFIRYGIQDTQLLIQLEDKLKLIQLAKMISYTTGVNLPNVRGTVVQWVSFMYNKYLDEGMVLPFESKFPKVDDYFLNHAINMEDLDKERRELFKRLYNGYDEKGETLKGQKFAGGIARATGKEWKWIYYLDFKSLYPTVFQWANIGIETIILPKDLPIEILDLRANFAIYYPKDCEAEDLLKYDLWYTQNVVFHKENREYMNSILKKYNVSMTPNGMFFRNDFRSVLSKAAEYLIDKRKGHKKEQSIANKKMKEMKEIGNYNKDDYNYLQSIEEQNDVYQLGIKTLNNAMFGSLSKESNTFAGQLEYFSVAVTSCARIGNLCISQAQNMMIDRLLGVEPKETKYGVLTHLDRVAQIQTDSVRGDSLIYINGEQMTIEEFFEHSMKNIKGEFISNGKDNYVKSIDEDIYTLSFNKDNEIVESKKINYVVAHKVKKKLFKIKFKGKEVVVTQDHSIIIYRNGLYLDIKPIDIIKGDKLISLDTISDEFEIEDLGVIEEWVYDIEVENNHNFFANDILVHNSKILSMDDIMVKKFGVDYEQTKTFEELTKFVLDFGDKYALPEARRVLDDYYAFAHNAFMPEKLEEELETVADRFLSIAPMKHAFRYAYKDGLQYKKEDDKIKVTGLSMIGKSTPKYHREELKQVLSILINGDMEEVSRFNKRVLEETKTKNPKQVCINVGVSSLDYPWDEMAQKFRRWVIDKNKYLTAPVNSRASLVHNKFVNDFDIPVKEIEAGDKISFVYMKEPNILGSDVFGFKDERVFDYKNLKDYIDYKKMYEKGFESGINLVINPLGWDITPKENLIDDDEW